MGLITCNASTEMDSVVYMLPKMCESGNNTFKSYTKRTIPRAQKAIDEVFKQGDYAE